MEPAGELARVPVLLAPEPATLGSHIGPEAMPALSSVAMFSDITNLFGSTPRQLCHDLLQELGRGSGDKALSQSGPDASPMSAKMDASPLSGSPLNSRLDSSPLSRLVNSPFGRLDGSPLSKAGSSSSASARKLLEKGRSVGSPAAAVVAAAPGSVAAESDAASELTALLRCAAVLEAAAGAAHDAWESEGMDSEWTSRLASTLSRLAAAGNRLPELMSILHLHGWSGCQFSGPPHRELLLADLERAAAAASSKASAAEAACGAGRPPRRLGRRGGA